MFRCGYLLFGFGFALGRGQFNFVGCAVLTENLLIFGPKILEISLELSMFSGNSVSCRSKISGRLVYPRCPFLNALP